MTTELTKAAQQALEALRANAIHYGDPLRCSRDAIAALERALTQRPAAQTERDTGPRVLREVFALCEDTMDKMAAESTEFSRGRAFEAKGISRAIGTWFQDEYCGQSHMGEPSLPAPQQATPERCKSCDDTGDVHDQIGEWRGVCNCPAGDAIREKTTPEPLIVKGAMAGMVDAQVRDLWPTKGATLAPQQATPGWSYAQVRVVDENTVDIGRVVAFADEQATPEPVGEVFHAADGGDDETGAGFHLKACVQWKNRGLLPSGTKLFTRPAPGVPEGFALVPVEPTEAMTTAVEHAMWEKPSVTGADVWSAVLAAAQAKGDQP